MPDAWDGRFDPLFAQIHGLLHEIGGIRIENCKSRAICHDQYFIGDGPAGESAARPGARPGAFIHLDLRFLEGRSGEIRQAIGEAVLALLVESFGEVSNGLDLPVTVKVGDIRAAEYFKYPAGTLTPQSGR